MKLISFQPLSALQELERDGFLECKKELIDFQKVGPTYNWVLSKMHKNTEGSATYPLWCWVKCNNGICPPKRKGESVPSFEVKITFNKKEEEVFITDFKRYSFLLSNMYIPINYDDKISFDNELKSNNILLEELKAVARPDKFSKVRKDDLFLKTCEKIQKSFDRCITTDAKILQGCVWRIDKSDVEKIEILKKDGYRYGSLNHINKKGVRYDAKEDFYKTLKSK